MESIKGYHFIETKVQSLIHKVYVSELDGDSSQLYHVESIYSRDVPQCYLQMIKEGPKGFGNDCILMEQIFAHPNAEEKAVVFVERRPPSPSPNLNDLLLKDKLSLRQRLTCILQILNAIPIVFRLGLLHDFSLSNMAFAKGKVMLFNFIKRDRSIRNTAKETEENVQKMISQMITISDFLEIDSIDIQIENQNTTRLKIISKRAGIKTEIDFIFNGEEISLSYINSFKNEVYREHSRKIMPEELKQCWNYFVLVKAEKLIDKIESYQSLKSQMQPQLQVGNNAKNLKFHDENNGQYPNCLIGTLFIELINQKGQKKDIFGTAVLISKNLLVSCAHNFIQFGQCKQSNSFEVWKVDDVAKIKFRLGEDQYDVEKYKIPIKYQESIKEQNQLYRQNNNNISEANQSEKLKCLDFDYALVKLSKQVNQVGCIEIVQNYKKTEKKLEVKGFYLTSQKIIKSRVVSSSQFQYDKDKISYVPQALSTESGFSGGPILVNLASEENKNLYYFVMVGIHHGRSRKGSIAVSLTEKIIAEYKSWEEQLMGKVNVFQNILDFEMIVNMDGQFQQSQLRLQDIVFNSDERKYFSQLFTKVSSKRRTDEHITKLYFGPDMINMEKMQELEAQKILLSMGCFTEQERYNNIIFLYHVRQYQNWMAEYARYSVQDGTFVFFIYISNRVLYFFENAKVHQQISKQYNKFLYDYRQAKQLSFFNARILNSRIEDKILKLLQIALVKIMDKIPLNQNFKKILVCEIKYMISLKKQFQVTPHKNIKLYEASRLSVYVYIFKSIFIKIGQLDNALQYYCRILQLVLGILTEKILTYSISDMKRLKFTFAWTLRKWIQKQKSVQEHLRIHDPQNQNEQQNSFLNDLASERVCLDQEFVRMLTFCVDYVYKVQYA